MVNHANGQSSTPRRLEPVRLGPLSRELQTPLVEALLNIERLQGMRLKPTQRALLDVAWSSVVSARSLLETLADLAPSPDDAAGVHPSVFRLAPMVESVIAALAPRAASRGLRIECAVADAIAGRIEGDHHRLHQLLTNLTAQVIRVSAGPDVMMRVRRQETPDDGDRILFQIGTPRTELVGEALDALIGPASWGLCERLAATLGGGVTRHGEGDGGFNVVFRVSLDRPGTQCNERDHVRRRLPDLQCNLGQVEDVSLFGMRMTSRRSRRGRVRVTMERGGTRIKCRARVVWKRKIDGYGHEHGLQFVSLKPQKVAAIHRLAEA